MKTLEKLVEQLENESNKEDSDPKVQIGILQEIGVVLINEYEICVGDLRIEPMLVEAYYYHKGKFEDNYVYAAKEKEDKAVLYARSRQQRNQGKLFIHFNDWGIDVCLTDSSDYYLSYLIKNALVNGEWQTQRQIGMNVCQKCSKYEECKSIWKCQYNDTVVLQSRRSRKDERIIFVPRVGIKNKDLLAALSAKDLASGKYDFTLPTGYAKQWKISVCALLEIMDEEKAKQMAKKKNGAKIEEKYWKLAKETLKMS
ncbi:MAG: hypothetical protein ACLU8W_06120 [Clostridia bacterium]